MSENYPQQYEQDHPEALSALSSRAGQSAESANEDDSFGLIRRAIEIVEQARPLPLSSSVRIEPAEILSVLDQALVRLPDEIRKARWLVKERNEFLIKTHAESELIIEEARVRAAQLVDRQEIVRQAKNSAQQTLAQAEVLATQKRHEAQDWCDRHLAKFEAQLTKISAQVNEARTQLSSSPAPQGPQTERELAAQEAANAFFDQDQI